MSQGKFNWVYGENTYPGKKCSASVMTFSTYISEGSLNYLRYGSVLTNIFLDEIDLSAVSLPWVLTPPTDFTVCVYQV